MKTNVRETLLKVYKNGGDISELGFANKNALFAQDVLNYFKDNGDYIIINDYYCSDDMDAELFAFNHELKVWQKFEKINFKKTFLKYIKEIYGEDLIYMFTDSDLTDIYNTCVIYSKQLSIETTIKNSSRELIININGKLFNVNKREFMEWNDSYREKYPFACMFTIRKSNEKIIELFNSENIKPSSIIENMDDQDIDDDVSIGYSVFDLIDYIGE